LPVKANLGGIGYYRVSHDAELLERLCQVAPQLAENDRLNLLHDTWALVEAGRAPVARYLDLAATLARDDATSVVEQITGVIDAIDGLRPPQSAGDAFNQWALAVLRAQFERLGWQARAGESPLAAGLRGRIINLLERLDDDAIKRDAFARFDEYLKDSSSLPADLREAVCGIVGRDGDRTRYDQLHQLARSAGSSEEQRMLYESLAGAHSVESAERTLALSLGDELIPVESARLVQQVAHTKEHGALAWRFAQQHLDTLLAKLPPSGTHNYVPGIFGAFHDASRADELEAFARDHLPPAAAPRVAKVADEIRFRAEFKSRILPAVEEWCAAALRK
jgi:aminopeptidase N